MVGRNRAFNFYPLEGVLVKAAEMKEEGKRKERGRQGRKKTEMERGEGGAKERK